MPQAAASFPLADADKCVKCALCLPHCPTYRETLDEGESPRGRIALMQGFATGVLDITPKLAGHLDRCLACRACEAVCPAEVPYGKLIDAARAEFLQHGRREPRLARLFAATMRHPALLKYVHWMLWLAQRLGLHRLAPIAPGGRRLARLLPSLAKPQRRSGLHSPSGKPIGEVELFLGCVARITQPAVTDAGIRVLNALGYAVRIPETQGCCGALDQHAGRRTQADTLARKNLNAFTGNAALLHTASGCGATLAEYPRLTGDPRAAGFSTRVRDISDFLLHASQLGQIQFKPWRARALVHNPCTLKNVLKTDKSVAECLRRIPELSVDALPANTGCCGAAGSYVMNEPETADRLADRIVAAVEKSLPTVLVTSNVGCALHLQAALARRGLNVPLRHPLEILARQLPGSASAPAV